MAEIEQAAEKCPVPSVTLITGGARTGKSSHAQTLAQSWGGERVLCVPTARETTDCEFQARIQHHRLERPSAWDVVEEPLEVRRVVRRSARDYRVILIDCLTLLVSNWFFAPTKFGSALVLPENRALNSREVKLVEARVEWCLRRCRKLAEEAQQVSAAVIVVTNEVGMGLVPNVPAARYFRDTLGRANQVMAAAANRVDWVTAGISMTIKRS